METKKIGKAIVDTVKTIGYTASLLVVAGAGAEAAEKTMNNGKCVFNFIRNKISPEVEAKRGLKTDKVDVKKGVWESDGKPVPKRKLQKIRNDINYKVKGE